MSKRYSIVLALCTTLIVAACGPTASIEDLGTFGGPTSLGLGINAVGNVTGASYTSSADPHGGLHTFLYIDGLGLIDVPAFQPVNIAEGQGINNGNIVVGGSFVEGFTPHAFIASATLDLTDLGTFEGGEYSYAWDVNNAGRVTGEADGRSLEIHAFLWTREAGMRDLGTLGGDRSIGRAINEGGQIAGESRIASGTTIAFRYTEEVGMVSIGTLPGGSSSSAYGINNTGEVVGESGTGPVLDPRFRMKSLALFGVHAFLWNESGGMIDLGHLGGGTSSARAISNTGIVVGTSTTENGVNHAFRWTRAEGIVDLNSLLPPDSGWVLDTAHDVNDRGQITGEGFHNGALRAFRFNPSDLLAEPSP
jgi:probable HAF family extracellular repeat protein